MAKYTIEDTSLTNIADAIRAKTGDSETITVALMPAAIEAIETGGGGSADFPDIVIEGNAEYALAGVLSGKVIELYPDKISTNNLTRTASMFLNNPAESFPFTLNGVDGVDTGELFSSCYLKTITPSNMVGLIGKMWNGHSMFINSIQLEQVPALTFQATPSGEGSTSQMFMNCNSLKEIGLLTNISSNNMYGMFAACHSLKSIPGFVNANFSKGILDSQCIFMSCPSLRYIPDTLLAQVMSNIVNDWNDGQNFNYFFSGCYALDEITNMGVETTLPHYNNMFYGAFENLYRVQEITFATDNGTPYVADWANQYIDLTNYVGYAPDTSFITNYNNGEFDVENDLVNSANKFVTSYDNKNPNWFSTSLDYSRYFRRGAQNTIDSLPNTSAAAKEYGANTIKFLYYAGSDCLDTGTLIGGGYIGMLSSGTYAAAATAKGWTLAFDNRTS